MHLLNNLIDWLSYPGPSLIFFLLIGLPIYISKQEIFRELSHILTVSNVPIQKKVEVIQLIYQLQVKELCGNRKQVSEISACLKVIYPPILNQLPSKEVELRDATVQFLQNRYFKKSIPIVI